MCLLPCPCRETACCQTLSSAFSSASTRSSTSSRPTDIRTNSLTFCLIDIGVRHSHRVCDQRLYRSQVFSQRPDIDIVHQFLTCLEATLDFEPRHCTVASRLPAGQVVLLERFKARIADLFDLGVSFQEFRDRHRIGGLTIHADRYRFAALRRKPGDLRRHDAAGAVLNEAHRLGMLLGLADRRAANSRVVPIHVLGRAVDRHVSPQF